MLVQPVPGFDRGHLSFEVDAAAEIQQLLDDGATGHPIRVGRGRLRGEGHERSGLKNGVRVIFMKQKRSSKQIEEGGEEHLRRHHHHVVNRIIAMLFSGVGDMRHARGFKGEDEVDGDVERVSSR